MDFFRDIFTSEELIKTFDINYKVADSSLPTTTKLTMCPYDEPNYILLDLKGLKKRLLNPFAPKMEGSGLWQKKGLEGGK